MTSERLRYTFSDGIAFITLDRPDSLNALDLQTAQDLFACANRLFDDERIRVVVLTGTGEKAFCAGGDLQSFGEAPDRARALLLEITSYLHMAIARLVRLPAPLIVAVNGVAAGAGLGLVGCADLAIASDRAKFTSAYTRIGLTPDAGTTFFLSRHIGLRRATELLLLNETLTASQALAWGLLNQVVAAEELHTAAHAMARRITATSVGAVQGVKELLQSGCSENLEFQLHRESQLIARISSTTDGREGIASFLQRRAPSFQA